MSTLLEESLYITLHILRRGGLEKLASYRIDKGKRYQVCIDGQMSDGANLVQLT